MWFSNAALPQRRAPASTASITDPLRLQEVFPTIRYRAEPLAEATL
jgi:hypothetical protein